MTTENANNPRGRLLAAAAAIRENAEVIAQAGDLGEFDEALTEIEEAVVVLRSIS